MQKRFFQKQQRLAKKLIAIALMVLASVTVNLSALSYALASDLTLFAGGANLRVPIESMAERKSGRVVRQQFDFSCGSAALATLLTYHYDLETTETDAFQSMWEVGDQDRIRKLGFSLLEMKNYLNKLNLLADGFQLSLPRIQEIGVPGIALIDVRGYRHFVVIKGITDQTVLLGDPSAGLISMPRDVFEERWDGIILFIRSNVSQGKASFNQYADWQYAPTAPHDRALDGESLQSISINQTRPSFSGFTIGNVIEQQ